MSDLTAALAACQRGQDRSYTIDANNFVGDQSVLIRVSASPPSDPAIPHTDAWYTLVMRAGDVVIVLTVTPFESASVPRETVEATLDVAITRAENS